MEWVIALLALTAMEIVLGIDNIVFITIVSSKLPVEQQPLARKLGLALALITRLLLLFALSYIVTHLQYPVFQLTSLGIPEEILRQMSGVPALIESYHLADNAPLPDHVQQSIKHMVEEASGVSWRDIILFFGGAFLVGKSVYEIHDEFGKKHKHSVSPTKKAFVGVLIQIALLDIVFSLDSVITAVGMVKEVSIMVTAIICAVAVMLIFAEPVSRFVDRNPTLKMLALSFLILIGVMLVAESIGAHMDKGYIYFAMFFALIVEFLNLGLRKQVPDSEDSAIKVEK